ncbi:hypothetical protein HU200_010226 [Digitaria exilis]|uniref:Ornithine decarboxylase n=1 Tax=Digitaria exilis TaxID=1010633 RepID=A0A835KNH8_9POAL|nr:hypothetical protein HU200_010226 [Digitaria exilis]
MAEAPAAMRAVLEAPRVKGREVLRLPCDAANEKDAVTSLVRRIVAAGDPRVTSAFNVLDLGKVAELFAAWRRTTPSTLAALGSCFDCASPAEMDAVLALGVAPDRIIYANPCKPDVGVDVTTFDSVEEVGKIKRFHPGCKLLLRLKVPDAGEAQVNLGTKYGALEEEVAPLLRAARSAGLEVTGVAFHVGCAVTRVGVYDASVKAARAVFDAAAELGLPPHARPRHRASRFEDACDVIIAAVARHFGDMPGVEVIGEPGQYFAETPFTLAARVFGKRTRGEVREYWIDDGIYGTLSCVVNINGYIPRPVPVASACHSGDEGEEMHTSTVFGPTLDSLDVVVRGYPLPELRIGDWLVFHDIGAYTTVVSTNFNGFSASEMKTYLASSV